MKKIWTLAILPIIALASCGKTQTEEETQIQVVPENMDMNYQDEVSFEDESLNENISTVITDDTQNEKIFQFSYEKDGNIVPVSGKFFLDNWIITGIEVDWVDLNEKGPLVDFAKNVPAQIIGKSLSWLQVDTVSGASYVTVGFNEYLSTVE